MKTIVEEFKTFLMEDGKSNTTMQSYVGDVVGLLKYLKTMGVEFVGELKRFYITSFKNYLVGGNYEPNTINKKINSIQSFNNFLIEKDYMKEVIVDLKKDRVSIATGSEHQVEIYTDKQVEKILFYIQNQKKVSFRDRMII